MPKRIPVDTDLVVETYKRLGSKEAVAKELHIAWETVAKHLNQFRNYCPACWKPKEDASHKFCADCRKKVAQRTATKIKARVAAGLCASCNELLDPSSTRFCWRHKQMATEAGSRWRKSHPDKVVRYSDQRTYQNSDSNISKHAILERDGNRCVICGQTHGKRRLEIHHIDQDHSHNASENMDTVCFDCHRAVTFYLMVENKVSLLRYIQKHYPA